MTNNVPNFGSLFETSRDAIIGVKDDHISYMNPTARDIFGMHTGDLASEVLPKDILSAASDGYQLCTDVYNNSYSVNSTTVGDTQYISLVGYSEKRNPQTAAICANITAQMSDYLLSLDYAISNMLEIAKDNKLDFGAYSNLLIRSQCRLQRLLRNLSTLEAISSGGIYIDPMKTDIGELIGNLVDTVSHLCPGKISFKITSDASRLIFAEVDSIRLTEALLNLITNSLQHTRDENCHIDITLKELGDKIIITVSDNCGGMSSDALSRVYSKFSTSTSFSAMTDGAGLGLSVSKGIIEAHGGTMIVESRENIGTLTRITLPIRSKRGVTSERFVLEAVDMSFILTQMSVYLDCEFFDDKYLD